MNFTKISANGQITVPIEIQQLLDLKSVDKILFFQKQDVEIVVSNASSKVIRKAQSVFTGAAEAMGISSEDNIQALVDEVHYEKEKPEWALLYVADNPSILRKTDNMQQMLPCQLS